jgi:hypothetical protein
MVSNISLDLNMLNARWLCGCVYIVQMSPLIKKIGCVLFGNILLLFRILEIKRYTELQ